MLRRLLTAVGSAGVLVMATSTTLGGVAAPSSVATHASRAVCAVPSSGVRCFARVVTAADGSTPLATTTYTNGYAPADLQAAYSLPGTGPAAQGTGPTVAIVDAYDNPNAHADLVLYRSQFGLAPLCDTLAAGDTTTHCVRFSQVNQSGGTRLPRGDTGWGEEIDLDIDMVSAICPACNILLVEANSNSFSDLGAAVNYAAGVTGVAAISNSYGTSGEFSQETTSQYSAPYNHPGIAVTASSGDGGYGVIFPAASTNVVAVGGTSLYEDNSSITSAVRGGGGHTWGETVWSGAGSGCSAYFSRPAWQTSYVQPYIDQGSSCTAGRVVADVSAVADPNTGVAVYDSYGSSNGQNWYVFGGTSVASPIIASVYAVAGNTGKSFAGSTPYPASRAYANPSGLHDVTAGKNGNCSRGPKRSSVAANAFLCTAEVSFDGPTGMGTPAGVSAAF